LLWVWPLKSVHCAALPSDRSKVIMIFTLFEKL
jgi:hypothetical protein